MTMVWGLYAAPRGEFKGKFDTRELALKYVQETVCPTAHYGHPWVEGINKDTLIYIMNIDTEGNEVCFSVHLGEDWYFDLIHQEQENPIPDGFGPQGHGVND